MAEEQKSDHDVEEALQQAIELLDDIAEWGRLYGVQVDHERLGHIRGQLDELADTKMPSAGNGINQPSSLPATPSDRGNPAR